MSYKPIVAVDFDGTLSLDSQYPNIGRFNTHLYEALMKLRGIGWSIVLWTCREGKELKEAVEWCKMNGLEFDAINENPSHVPFKSRKVVANIYIDDNAYMPKTDFYRFVKNIVSMDNYQLIESPIFTTKKEE